MVTVGGKLFKMELTDDRKSYFLDLICVFFELSNKDAFVEKNIANESLNNFLNDVFCNFLRVFTAKDSCNFSNEAPTSDNFESNQLIFLKTQSELLTKENIKTSVIVMTLFGSPIHNFYHSLCKFYAPALLAHDLGQEPQVQNTLKILDYKLKHAIHKSKKGESLVITSVSEEIRFWESMADSAKSVIEKENAKAIWEVLSTVENDFSSLDGMLNVDLEEIIDSCSSMLDDLWRVEPSTYEQSRIEKLIEMAGNSIALYIQRKVDALNVWTDDFDKVRDVLNFGISACDKWNESIYTLSTVYWSSSSDRKWRGKPLEHLLCAKLRVRLNEIKDVRSAYRQLTRLLSSSEQKELGTSASFSFFKGMKDQQDEVCKILPMQYCFAVWRVFWTLYLQLIKKFIIFNGLDLCFFDDLRVFYMSYRGDKFHFIIASGVGLNFSGLKPTICSPYTERLWKAALMQFDKSLYAMENRVASKLKTQLNHLNANTLQLLQELKRYQELIKRQNIAAHLVPERENLLEVLQEYVNGINVYDEEDTPLLDFPPTVSKIYWARVLESKIKEVVEANNEILSDLKGSGALDNSCKLLLKELNDFEKKQFELWVHTIKEEIRTKELALSETSRVLHLKAGQMVEVNYNSRLVRLVREVQQLSVIGLNIPRSIREVSDRAVKFMNQAKALEQIANFHNTIGDRIIPSQKPMLLPAAQQLDALINSQQTVTWSDTTAVDKYILTLQEVVERLSKENNKLGFYHNKIRDKVAALFNVDIIRQQNSWKQGLRDIKEIIAQVEAMKFPNMKSWKLHWDYQLYKALERQYQLSLSNLHLHFPEIRVELIYRQQKLQFHPPVEEIRLKYYSQVKRFLSIPSSFSGVSENTQRLFSTIISRNASRFGEVFIEAENLFERLEKVKLEWNHWMALGSLNLEEIAEENLSCAEDWDLNFRASKTVGQEIAKLPYNDEKIGCITVSVLPIRAEMELHNRRYWDVLVLSLQTSILRDVTNLNTYIADATQILNAQPKTISEVGEANIKHAQLMESSVEVQNAFESTIKKNKTLASWTKEKIEQVSQLVFSWDNFQSQLQSHKSLIGKQVERMKIALKGEAENLASEIEKFRLKWEVQRPKDTDVQDADTISLRKIVTLIKEKIEEWNVLKEKKEKVTEECKKFKMPEPELVDFEKTNEDLQTYQLIWGFYEEFHSELSNLAKEEWILFRGKTYRLDELLQNWEKKVEEKPATSVTVKMLQEINTYKAIIPLLKYLRGEMFSEKHWLELFVMLGMSNKSPETLTLGDFLAVKDRILISDQNLKNLNNEAASEITIRQALGELDAWEVQARFTLTPHSDSKMNSLMLIKDFSDVLNKIGDNQCLLQSILNSPNAKSFSDRTSIWDSKLTSLDEFVSNLNVVQRKWVYLEPIFRNGSFAKEQARFERVDQDFRYIMNEVSKDNRVKALLRIVNLRQTLGILIDQLTRCQNSLNVYLQEKRSKFPRFYFLGDEDLLELLGQATKEKVIQTHLKKLFAGINSVVMTEGVIKGVQSLHGETVTLVAPVKVTNCIEEWLSSLSAEVKKTLKFLLIQYETESKSKQVDPLKFPSQILCLGESLWFTSNCESNISTGKLRQFHASLKAKLDFYSGNSAGWEREDNLLQLKLKALLIDTVHHIEIVECLIENHVTDENDWHWQKQLRFYVGHEKSVVVRMVDAELEYTYEYLGNTPKLVWTPLTEKCFLTLTQAIRMGLGGNPFGPAGTGKTESVKALGGLLGRQVLVFNCDKGIDVKSMGRIFTGLVKCGAWGCFDEFNRLEEATLSAVSMLIQPIQIALQERRKSVKILDEEVPMDVNCGIFVTLNPAGKNYGGRKKMPDNLKQLFRPVVMSVPDEILIAQVSLLCEGFKDAKVIGRKLVEIFDLSKNLLSQQKHYDWGLRALKTVLGSCGTLFRENRKKKQGDNKSSELELAVEAVRFNTLSKLTFKDSHLFDKIVQDVFVGVKFTSTKYEKLKEALKSSCDDLGFRYNPNQIEKCVEVYEQMQQRMGVALVGPSGTGKTTILKLLKCALQKLGQGVKQCILNPKAMPRTQLFGQVDLDTRQWSEGVLTANALKLHTGSADVLSWLICDGDIDPDWVEALNSVLDDNRLLTLPSGWRIQFGPNVNFLFETSDLNHASPATVSRLGVIYLSDQIIDTSVVVDSWLATQSEECRRFIEPYISDFFYKSVEWIRRKADVVVPYSVLGLVSSGLSHLADVRNKSQFAVALIYGLGANLTTDSREQFAKHVFELLSEYIPDSSNVLDCYYNSEKQRIDALPPDLTNYDFNQSFSLVLTTPTKTSLFVLEPWVNSYQPILICGAEGSGKTVLINHCLSRLPALEIATIYCSQLISPHHVIQKLKQVCMITTASTGRVFRPKNSQKLVVFIKNLELAAPDAWGTNMLITWLQQVITYQGFYDSDLEWTSLEKIQFIGTLAKHGHGLAVRLTSIMRIYALSPPDAEGLKMIYSVYTKSVISQNFGKFKAWTVETRISSLVNTLIYVYEKVRSNFTQIMQKHYLFSPRDLTRWCTEIKRYKIDSGDPIGSFLEVVAFVGLRIFHDRLVNKEDRTTMIDILQTVMENEWGRGDLITGIEDVYYVSDESRRFLHKIDRNNWTEMVNKGILMSAGDENEILLIDELLRLSASIDKSLTAPDNSIILAGRPGIGRKTALRIVSALHSARLITLNMSLNYNIKNFKIDLKTAFHQAGIEGESVYLVIEDYQIVDNAFIDMINSLLNSGEVPGLYNTDELGSVISSLKDSAAAEGFSGSAIAYFASRILKNLHVVLILDFEEAMFKSLSENNLRLFTKCEVIWSSEWSTATMKIVPRMLFSRLTEKENLENIASIKDMENFFLETHREVTDKCATPRRFMAFVKTFIRIYLAKQNSITKRTEGLRAGVTKLNQTRTVVNNLRKEAAKQEESLAEKQSKASAALDLIGETMRNANTHKEKMEKLREQAVQESKQLTERKKAIDKELSEVNPLIEEARQAVGNIKNEALSEIRSLRAPPDVIRDILEGVLRLMGIQDTSWNNMKTFLAKRGVKEEIRTFDAHQITAESIEDVNELLAERSDSFDPKTAKRASVAAAPLAAWVKANIKYAMVLEKIRPLEKEQKNLQLNLKNIEDQVGNISMGLGEVDERVNELKNQLNTYTREAAVIEIHLSKAQETMASAQELVSKLEDEYNRWRLQLNELDEDLKVLSKNAFLGAAFITYLAAESESTRRSKLADWKEKLNVSKFSFIDFLATEQVKVKWESEGLSSDQLSIENAVIMLESWLWPLLIDPDGIASKWVKNHFSDQNFETISQQSPKLQTNVEFAIRFGKTLTVEDVDVIHPILMPILRKDIISQGPRKVIHVGEKAVDYNKNFKMFLVSKNTATSALPDAAAISFTVTQQGLAGQLLALAVQQERPELETCRSELLKKQEEMKLRLLSLQENLLEQLASAQGDILDNKDLLNSLNQTKTSSEEISKALEESKKLETQLDKECESYRNIADFGARLFFIIKALSEMNTMYRFSLQAYKKLFCKSLKGNTGEAEEQKNLIRAVYQYVSRSLFNCDRLSFALYLFASACPERVGQQEWKVLKGEAVLDSPTDPSLREILPSWCEEDRLSDINNLRTALPDLFSTLHIPEMTNWLNFSNSQECEKEVPKNLMTRLSPFQILLLIQAFRPDRLHSAMTRFVVQVLDIKTLSPSSNRLSEIAEESVNNEPILVIVSPGADPSEELRTLAKTLPSIKLYEVALGEGQTKAALDLLKSSAREGTWLCLKNLHLMTSWLSDLENEIRSLDFHPDFRLWLTTEPHDNFSPVLAESCLKLTYEAPPGIKKNLQRTFGSWSSEMYRRKGVLFGRTMFAAAWFHAVVQERRIYIPQGWSKFYEISDSDLRATVDLITRIFAEASHSINWSFIHGLLLNAIYGSRMDNKFDIEILGAYLREFFNENVLNRGENFGPNLSLPSSESYSEYLQLIYQLSDYDKPSFFGLPENIERSWQKIRSSQIIEQLKVLEHSTKSFNSDGKNWLQTLSPTLNQWKKLNQNAGLLEIKLSEKRSEKVSEDPIVEFIQKDFQFGVRLVQTVHQTLAAINKVIRGFVLPDTELIKAAKSLMTHQTPIKWQNVWEGPENSLKYLASIMGKALTLQKLKEKPESDVILQEEIDLGVFFQPERFVKAFKQLSARKSQIPLDEVRLFCKWTKSFKTKSVTVRLKNLQLEGASFDGRKFVHTTMESPIVVTASSVVIAFIEKDSLEFQQNKGEVVFPVYRTSKRENLLLSLPVPCEGSRDEWSKTGAAFFLKD